MSRYSDPDDFGGGPRQSVTPGWTYRKMGPRWVLRQERRIRFTTLDVVALFQFCRVNRLRPTHEPQVTPCPNP